MNITQCIQTCLPSFPMTEKEASQQNNICLSTAAIGTLILFSGLQDTYRIVPHLKNKKWSVIGNSVLILVALIKIAAGASMLGNAFTYAFMDWNSGLFTKCQHFCKEMLHPPAPTLSPEQPSSLPLIPLEVNCCDACDDTFKVPNNPNFGLALAWSIVLLTTGIVKSIYDCAKRTLKCCNRNKAKPLVTLSVKEWKWAKTELLPSLTEIIYGIAIITFISSNLLGNDEEMYYEDPRWMMMSSSSSTIIDQCQGICQQLGFGSYDNPCY